LARARLRPTEEAIMSILKRGLSGEPVKILQAKLAVTADGQFGPGTETALKTYQQQHGLKVDGIAGPDTFAQVGLYELILLKPGTSGDTVSCSSRWASPTTANLAPAPRRRCASSNPRTVSKPTVSPARRRSRR
jgi:Putative peptidoglycan binding domain